MESTDTEVPLSADGTPADDGTAHAAIGRPEHTFASIVLMCLVAAGALYGVLWSVQEHTRVIHAWDFRETTAEKTPWDFPRLEKEQDGNGVTSLALQTGPGPEMMMDLDTDTVRLVRVEIEILRMPEETPVDFSLEWYWASEADVAAAEGAWPYSTERGTAFRVLDRHEPRLHTAQVYDHAQWTGSIARGFIGLKFPADEPGPFLVRTFRIEFLE